MAFWALVHPLSILAASRDKSYHIAWPDSGQPLLHLAELVGVLGPQLSLLKFHLLGWPCREVV